MTSSPFRIRDFWAVATPGTTLCLLDGTYRGASNMISPSTQGAQSGLSGTKGNPITIRALNDGHALIDGEHQRGPVQLIGNSWFVLEGFNAKRAGPAGQSVVGVRDEASNVIVRRVVAWDAMINRNNAVVSAHSATNVLFEDVAIFGTARSPFSPSQSGNNVILRRVWVRWEGSIYGSTITAKFRYNNLNPLYENVLLTWDEISMPENFCVVGSDGVPTSTCNTSFKVQTPQTQIATEGWRGSTKCSGGQRLFGSILYATAAQKISYPSALRFGPAGPSASETQDTQCVDVRHVIAAISPSNARFGSTRGFFFSSLGMAESKGTIRNLTSIAGVPNSISTTKWDVNPTPDVAHGTSLAAVPSPWTQSGTKGANLCNRWVNGQVTDTPLWPWPMNERIKAATASAGAYSGPCPGCSGTMPRSREATDVTAEIESLLGPIPAQCRR